MPRDDFNYKVALASGSKSLEAGQLRKAEEQFRYAVKRCPECGGGYRGLAKVFVEMDDRASALETLREGAQVLARAGNRLEAIELLRDAVRLAPEDLAVHRRYAAALANAERAQAAVEEYDRFISLALGRNDQVRAQLELAYARETLGDLADLRLVAERITARMPAPPLPARSAVGAQAGEAHAPQPGPRAPGYVVEQPFEEPAPAVTDPRERALLLDARAQELLARHDPQAAAVALEAARALLGEGLRVAAGDLLLQVVATGAPDRDAQRLLVDVVKTLGRGDLARDKCALLAEALRLDGRPDAAAEVERLAAVP